VLKGEVWICMGEICSAVLAGGRQEKAGVRSQRIRPFRRPEGLAATSPERLFAGQPERRRGVDVALRFKACALAVQGRVFAT